MRIMYNILFFLKRWLKKGNPCCLVLILFIVITGAGCASLPSNHDITTTPTTFPTPVITPYPYTTIEEARSGYADYTIPEYLPEGYNFSVAYYVDGPDRRIDTYFSPPGDRRRQPPPLQDMSIYLHQRQDPTPFCSGRISGEPVIVDINGYEGTFVKGSKLTWYAGNYSFCLMGPFNQSEMEKMAESMPVP
jgi:hypothetical protein